MALQNILLITIPAAMVVLISWLLIRAFLGSKREQAVLELKLANQNQTLPIRLQAYERLTVFLERMNPQSLVARVNQGSLTPLQLRDALVLTVKAEFEHNVSQQIYVSAESCNIVLAVKEELINTIDQSAGNLKKGEGSMELIKGIMDYYMSQERRPMQNAMDRIKADVQLLF